MLTSALQKLKGFFDNQTVKPSATHGLKAGNKDINQQRNGGISPQK
jgi:hypothetical protein